jgi:hypothetical protein
MIIARKDTFEQFFWQILCMYRCEVHAINDLDLLVEIEIVLMELLRQNQLMKVNTPYTKLHDCP